MDETLFACVSCGWEGSSSDLVWKDVPSPNIPARGVFCPDCDGDVKVKQEPALSAPIAAYPCDMCDKSFGTKKGLYSHKRIHKGK